MRRGAKGTIVRELVPGVKRRKIGKRRKIKRYLEEIATRR